MESVPQINRFLASMAIDQYHPFFMVKLVKPPFFMLKPPFFMVQPPFSHRFFSRTRHPRLVRYLRLVRSFRVTGSSPDFISERMAVGAV